MGVFNNFPYANFHELNADWIIEQVRKVMDEWEEYKTDMDLWKLGVDDQLAEFQAWFDNLDVQDEVRTVMNELILSGEFIEITSPQIVSATEAWLAAHITPTTPAVDDTLSISGAAADAKVTGDRITDLKEEISEPTRNLNDSRMGRYGSANDGAIYPRDNKYYGMAYFIPVTAGIKYTFSFGGLSSVDTINTTVLWEDATNAVISRLTYANINTRTIEAPEGATKLNVNCFSNSEITLTSDAHIQIEQGETATEYIRPRTAIDIYARTDAEENTNGVAELLGIAIIDIVANDNVIIPADSNMLEDGAYDNVTGKKIDFAGYKRTKGFIRANEFELYISKSANNVYINCYDENKEYISQVIARGTSGETANVPKVTPAGTTFIALSSNGDFNIHHISSAPYTGFEYPFETGTHYIDNAYINNNGAIATASTFGTVYFADVEEGDKFYTNANNATTFVCFDANNNVLTHGETYEQRGAIGRVYTVPAGTKWLAINIDKSKKHGDDISSYITKCNGDKILCIGASITYLDGTYGFDSMNAFVGYQKQLRMKGFDVYSYGYSGYCFAYTNGDHGSIYTEIVTNQADVDGFDYVILSDAAYNDVLYHLPVGDMPTVYNNYNYDVATTSGAILAIIKYIRDNNDTAKILLTTFPKSEAQNRSWVYTKPTYDAIKYLAVFESCKLIDVFNDINVQAFTDAFDLNFADDTHPNYYGMEKVGKLILQRLKEYTDYDY